MASFLQQKECKTNIGGMKLSKDVLYKKSYFNRIGELRDLSPEAFNTFLKFDEAALKPGKLSSKLKELIAVAVAHITGCPYCIELHVANLKKAEGTKEEMAEAITVATALKAGAALAHGVNAIRAYDNSDNDSLYQGSYFQRIKEFSTLTKYEFDCFLEFDQAALKPGLLSKRDKELIAVACAHVTGCPYCIDLHTKAAKKVGVSLEELSEAIFVATALKAGSALAHSVNALNAYDE